jgi:hypothetical protein
LPKIKKEMKVLVKKGGKPTYITFDKFNESSPELLQVNHDASIRLEFKTDQLKDIRVPKENWNIGKLDEPIVRYFKEHGKGGANQAMIYSSKFTSKGDLVVSYE